ncbi:MAG: hypothetical protein Q4E17_03815 [Synergistes sp.]|nr:hypothetical protein [Synergistes sp.]
MKKQLAAVMTTVCVLYAATAFGAEYTQVQPPAATGGTNAPAAQTSQQTNTAPAQNVNAQNTNTQTVGTQSAAAGEQTVPTQVPAAVSTGTENTIVKPSASEPAFQTLERVETIVYGAKREGGLIYRLGDVEKTVFGRELPGTLTERQTALLDFLEKGTGTQPSFIFKISIAEWGIEQKIRPTQSLVRRVDTLEAVLEGAIKGGALVSRVERILSTLLPDGVTATPIQLPKDTLVQAELRETLTVKNIKVNDIIILALREQIVVGDMLVAPKGSRIFGHITKVKPPRSFGRSSEISMLIDSVEVLGPSVVPVNFGEAAKQAMDVDSGMIGAAGATIGGAVLLGPVGLAGGFLVRGNDKQLKEGTLFVVQTTDAANVYSYKIPQQITPITQPETSEPQGTKSAPVQQ